MQKMLRFHGICVLLCVLWANTAHATTVDPYYTSADISTESNRNSMMCNNIRPQHSVNIQQITGVWYGNEIIMHTDDVPGVFEYDSCVIIHLSDTTDQMQMYMHNYNHNTFSRYPSSVPQYNNNNNNNHNNQHQHQNPQHRDNDQLDARYLRLVWSEGESNVEYTFNYTADSPGLWYNVGDQRGSLLNINKYTHFKGNVQIVKAVQDHLVLTFCGNDLSRSVYTIVLSRTSGGLSEEELRSIRNLLTRRHLSTETIRKVCSGAPTLTATSIGMLMLLSLLGIWKTSVKSL